MREERLNIIDVGHDAYAGIVEEVVVYEVGREWSGIALELKVV